MEKSPDLQTVIDQTLEGHKQLTGNLKARTTANFAFQWPWDIAGAGARHLRRHGSAIDGLVRAGSKVATSPGVLRAVASGPSNPANTDRVIKDGIFTSALDSVRADHLLRTVLVGWSSGAQVGLFGGGGGTGVAYDIIERSNRSGVRYGAFDLGIGGKVSVGLIVGAMTAEPGSLNADTCVWSFGASIVAVGVFVQVIMKSSDLSLIGFGLNLGGGGAASTVGYGAIHTL